MKEGILITIDTIRGLLKDPENPAVANYEVIHDAWNSAVLEIATNEKPQKPFYVDRLITLAHRNGDLFPAMFRYETTIIDTFPDVVVSIYDSAQYIAAHRYWSFDRNIHHIDAKSNSKSFEGHEGEGLSIALAMLTNEVLPHVAAHFSYWWQHKPILATIYDLAYSPRVERIGWTTQIAKALGYTENLVGDFEKLYPTPGSPETLAK